MPPTPSDHRPGSTRSVRPARLRRGSTNPLGQLGPVRFDSARLCSVRLCSTPDRFYSDRFHSARLGSRSVSTARPYRRTDEHVRTAKRYARGVTHAWCHVDSAFNGKERALMREILGRRRRLRLRRKEGTARLDAALTCATVWQWPVLPGVGTAQAGPRGESGGPGCACPEPDCAVPGAHPFDPGLLAATTDERMVRWWWTHRPAAPVMLATGGRAPCAVSLPAVAGARALSALDALGMRLGPVVATPTRWSLLVAPYTLERLGELLYAKDWVPSSLRFHGEGAISSCRRPGPARARSAGSGPRAARGLRRRPGLPPAGEGRGSRGRRALAPGCRSGPGRPGRGEHRRPGRRQQAGPLTAAR